MKEGMMMIIKAKYFSVCPCCNKNIMVGAEVVWEKGVKPYHVECSKKSVVELMEIFFKTNKGQLKFLEREMINGHEIYNFQWTRKDGKEKLVQYYQNGDRYFKDKPKALLGVR
jgi:hypothetical protein